MVLDGGGQFIPAGIVDLHKVSYYWRPWWHMTVPRKITIHTTQERNETIISEHTTWVQYIILDREVSTPSPCE